MDPKDHPDWPVLTVEQRRAVNEVWNDTVVAALEETQAMKRRMEAAIIDAQDARGNRDYIKGRLRDAHQAAQRNGSQGAFDVWNVVSQILSEPTPEPAHFTNQEVPA